MKILYDHQIFTKQEFGGISRYFYELIKRFEATDDSCNVAISYTNNAYLNKNTYHGVQSFFPDQKFKGKMMALDFINRSNSLKQIKKSSFNVFHPTYYDTYFLNSIGKKPFVVTFLDMIHEKFSSHYSDINKDPFYLQKKTLLNKAAKIIAISECTKKDIIEIFNVKGDNIDVVYLGNSLINKTEIDQAKNNDEYILFVGNRGGYKNFLFFIETIAKILISKNLKLICAGGGDFVEVELNLIKKLGLKEAVIYKNFKSDEELSSLYSNALCFVFPTLYEGFGIPVLESFACNCPIVSSNGGSLPEIVGDAGIYFSPENSHEIYNSVEQVINSKSIRDNLIKKGNIRLKEFSWDRTYNQTIDIYKSIA